MLFVQQCIDFLENEFSLPLTVQKAVLRFAAFIGLTGTVGPAASACTHDPNHRQPPSYPPTPVAFFILLRFPLEKDKLKTLVDFSKDVSFTEVTFNSLARKLPEQLVALGNHWLFVYYFRGTHCGASVSRPRGLLECECFLTIWNMLKMEINGPLLTRMPLLYVVSWKVSCWHAESILLCSPPACELSFLTLKNVP